MSKQNTHGFCLLRQERIEELHSTLYLYRHEKSGAELLYMENTDENKVFGAAFRTPPPDSTGVPHIIEHCVLSGSRKYKTKEPFMTLVQSSLATFLNAITFPDKTIYPVASRNDRDFANLMDVYLDAVFYPMIAEDERIFRQEGWRYELESEDSDLRLSGVVYNEMRGAYSSPFEVLYSETIAGLWPDTPYANESGGEPYTIPSLTYEAFKAFHARYYHPSNTRLFLYGAMDINEKLEYLDREYLSSFDAIDPDSALSFQEPFAAPRVAEGRYSLSSGESPEDKHYLAWAVSCGRYDDVKGNYMLAVLADMLFSSQAAPVKLALLEQGLCQDVVCEPMQFQQSALTLFLLNAPEYAKDLYREVIEGVLSRAVTEGLDREALKASLNRIEYNLREGEGYTTLGILYFIKGLDSWLYGGDPGDQLRYEKPLAELRASLDSDIWERFIEKNFLNNPHKLLLTLAPEPGMNEKKDEKVHWELQEKKAAMSAEEVASLVEKTKALAAWQLEEDTPEAKATMPRLSLADINTKLPDPPCLVSEAGDDKVLEHPIFTSGIHYLRLSFPLDHIRSSEVFSLALLTLFLGAADTKVRDYKALDTAVYLETGGMSFKTELLRHETDKKLMLRFMVTLKTLDKEGQKWPELLREILTETLFEDDRRLLEILKMELLSKEQSITNRGNDYAKLRLQANYSESARLQDEMGGVAFYLRLKELVRNFDEAKEEMKRELRDVYAKVFTRGGAVLSLTTDEESMKAFRAAGLRVLEGLPAAAKEPAERSFEPRALREGIQVSSNVQYVTEGYDYELLGETYNGKMVVLASYLSRSYLHNQIRAKGGAYGAGLQVTATGGLSLFSYRDPELKKTLEVYRGLAAWLREQPLEPADVEQYVIGSVNRFDPPLSPAAMGALAYARYMTGKGLEDAEQALAEAIAVTGGELRAYADLLDKVMEKNLYCVTGSASVLEDNKDLFDALIRI